MVSLLRKCAYRILLAHRARIKKLIDLKWIEFIVFTLSIFAIAGVIAGECCPAVRNEQFLSCVSVIDMVHITPLKW